MTSQCRPLAILSALLTASLNLLGSGCDTDDSDQSQYRAGPDVVADVEPCRDLDLECDDDDPPARRIAPLGDDDDPPTRRTAPLGDDDDPPTRRTAPLGDAARSRDAVVDPDLEFCFNLDATPCDAEDRLDIKAASADDDE